MRSSEPSQSPPLLYRPEEAARLLGCGRAYLYQRLADGSIPSVKVGRLRRIPADSLAEFVESLRGQADGGDAA